MIKIEHQNNNAGNAWNVHRHLTTKLIEKELIVMATPELSKVCPVYQQLNFNFEEKIPYGYCQCGCGQKTGIAKINRSECGWIKGQPKRFILGHNMLKMEKSQHWKGGKTIHQLGYIQIYKPKNKNSQQNGYMFEHVFNAEKALGKTIPQKAIVHHFDLNKANNKNNNLVICQDDAYHRLLHQRVDSLKNSGNPDKRKCKFCKKYDYPENLYFALNGGQWHRGCANKYNKQRRERIKNESSSTRR